MSPLSDEVHKLLKEQEKQSIGNRKIVRLPCGHGNVEITKPGDQMVACPQCYKRFYLIWSRIGDPKIQG